ncbi:MAG: ZIP family metal transporter, partial [Gaiellales bacterium]
MSDDVLLAFLVTLAAGLATGIGSIIAFVAKTTNRAFLSAALGFSAGVMIYVSFMEIMPKALVRLEAAEGALGGYVWLTVGFLGGMVLMAFVDRVIPSFGHPHEPMPVEMLGNASARGEYLQQGALRRMGAFTALAIAIHNFPEGLATFLVLLEDPTVGIAIADGLALAAAAVALLARVPAVAARVVSTEGMLPALVAARGAPPAAAAA